METFSAIDSERALLGAIILDGVRNPQTPTILRKAKADLSPSDFTNRNNRELFSIVLKLHDDEKPFYDPVALSNEADRQNVLRGDGVYLGKLLKECTTSTGADYHISEIKNAGVRRSISGFKNLIADMPIENFMEKADSAFLKLKEQSSNVDGVSTYAEITRQALDDIDAMASGKVKGVAIGFPAIDKHLGGLQAGEVMVVAARPSVGKSAFLKDCLEAAGVPALFFSLEMPNVETAKRHIAGFSGVDFGDIRTSSLSANDYSRIINAINRTVDLPIFYCDRASMTIDDIVSLSFGMKIKENIGLIGIDYLQLISPKEQNRTRESEVSEISRSLKILAKDLKIPIICLSQLNREIEKRKNKRPQLSDLRESGAVEQDADIVSFIIRKLGESKTEFFIKKARNSGQAKIRLHFDGAHQKFKSVSNSEEGE